MTNDFYYDCEFLEGTQTKRFLGIPTGTTKPTIELISIGIVRQDDRKYYAISKDFNLKEAWNRFEIKKEWHSIDESTQSTRDVKVYWIRENVLKPIFYEWKGKDINFHEIEFTYKEFKQLLNKYGKSNKQIAEEVKAFVYYTGWECDPPVHSYVLNKNGAINLYGYYSAYDHVALCWLFGKMIDLPTGFPMLTIDLKQELERLNETLGYNCDTKGNSYKLQEHPDYPKQANEHNALSDAIFNKQLHEFIKTL